MNTVNMISGNKVKWLLSVAAGAAMLAMAAGCQPEGTDVQQHGEAFLPPESERAPFEFGIRSTANAARADATVRDYHFNDHDLNSLGEERLDGMLYWRNGAPLVVYIDLPADDPKTAGRRETVIAYLKDRRLTDDQIILKSGPNPDSNSPVAPILAAQQGGGGNAPPAAPAGGGMGK